MNLRMPKVDVIDQDDRVVVRAEVSGVKKEDLDYAACSGKNKPTSEKDNLFEGIAAALLARGIAKTRRNDSPR